LQRRSAAIVAVVASLLAVIATVLASVVAAVDAVGHDGGGGDCGGGARHRSADHSASDGSCWSQWHGRTPSLVSSSSASNEAMIAWMGILPEATSCPPARRAADANGAAHRFWELDDQVVDRA
jgi:hypothetical protein